MTCPTLAEPTQEIAEEAKIKYNAQLDDLNEKKEKFQKEIQLLKLTGSSNWHKVKIGIDGAWEGLKAAIEDIKNKMNQEKRN